MSLASVSAHPPHYFCIWTTVTKQMTGEKLHEAFFKLAKILELSILQLKKPKHLSGWICLCHQVEQGKGTIYSDGPTRNSQSQPLDHGLRPALVMGL